MRLRANDDLHLDYLVRKIGLDPDDESELKTAEKIYADNGIIEVDDEEQVTSMWPQICLMLANLSD